MVGSDDHENRVVAEVWGLASTLLPNNEAQFITTDAMSIGYSLNGGQDARERKNESQSFYP